jgi:hypothetical protein
MNKIIKKKKKEKENNLLMWLVNIWAIIFQSFEKKAQNKLLNEIKDFSLSYNNTIKTIEK